MRVFKSFKKSFCIAYLPIVINSCSNAQMSLNVNSKSVVLNNPQPAYSEVCSENGYEKQILLYLKKITFFNDKYIRDMHGGYKCNI